MYKSSHNDPFSCAGIGLLRWSCSHYCADWQMNFSSDRYPGLKSFLSSVSCPSRTTHGSWAPPGRSSFCWPAWRSIAPRCWATSPTSPTNTPRQTMSCRGEEYTACVTHLLFAHLILIFKHVADQFGSLIRTNTVIHWKSLIRIWLGLRNISFLLFFACRACCDP